MAGTIIALNIKYMDNNDGIDKTIGHHVHVPDGATTVLCKLFSDAITHHLCDVRRRELNARGIFSCEGCVASNNNEGGKKNV